MNFMLIFSSNKNLEYLTKKSGRCEMFSPKRNSGDGKEMWNFMAVKIIKHSKPLLYKPQLPFILGLEKYTRKKEGFWYSTILR
jgi:hypothetical protein